MPDYSKTPVEQGARDILSRIDQYESFREAARAFRAMFPEDFSTDSGARSFLRRRMKNPGEDHAVPGDSKTAIEEPTKVAFDEHRSKGEGKFDFKGKLDKPMTVDELLEVHGVDLSVWEVDRIKVNKWGVTSKMGSAQNGDERLEAAQNYQIAAWLVRRKERPEVILAEAADSIIDSISQVVAKKTENWTPPKSHSAFHSGEADPDRMLEVSIFDLHMGKLCWAEETGHEDWDSKIGASAALTALDDLLQFFPNYGRIWLPLGHDFFNSDGPGENDSGGRTTKGTNQDEDSRWAKSLNTGIDVALEIVERCKKFAPVDVTIMRGNHDEQRCVFMGRLLSEVYKHDPHVEVDATLGMLKNYQWGNNFLATCHGQLESQQKVVTECAIKFPTFGGSQWREIHTGHGHRMRNAGMVIDGMEEQSVRWRMIPSLTGVDSYHSRNLYHNHPAAECYLWDKENLYMGHHSHNRSRVAK